MKKLILWFVMFLLVLPLAFSKVQTVTTGDTGYDIQLPIDEYISKNTDYKFNIHVFNKTDGMQVTNAHCTLHLYGNAGNHLFESTSTTVSFDFDYIFNVSKTNFTNGGAYTYIVNCYNETYNLGGAGEGVFIANSSGRDDTNITFILGIAAVSFILLYFAFNLNQEHFIMKLLSLIMGVTSLIIMPAYFVSTNPQMVFYKLILWFIRLFFMYILIYGIYAAHKFMNRQVR